MKKARIKILHVVLSLEPGGLENGVVNVARRLDPNRFEVHVCCLQRAGAFAERLPNQNLIHVLGKKPGISPATVLRLAKVIRRVKPEVVHTHNLGPLLYGGLATAFGLTRPILHGEHGFHWKPPKRAIFERQVFYRACRKIHTVSESLRQELAGYGLPTNKMVVLLNGVDAERFMPDPGHSSRPGLKLLPEHIVIGVVGRFDRRKRHLAMIEAFERLAIRQPAARLLFVGDGGELRLDVAARVSLSPVADRIVLAGFQNEPAPYYQSMDLLAAPSVYEGLSNAVLEAMSCGVPVLAHTACGNAEIITDGRDGLVRDLDNVEKLAAALEQALRGPGDLRRLGQQARETVSQRFSMPAMVENYARLYEELAG